jgi:predicted nuclease of restriction endonuclease-like (RecB) superfamily
MSGRKRPVSNERSQAARTITARGNAETSGAATSVGPAASPSSALIEDLRALIERARAHVAQQVNAGLVLLYWELGARVRRDVLGGERGEYGEQVLAQVAARLTEEYGRGFSYRNLANMVRFAERFPDREIVQTLSATLSWSHLAELLTVDDPLKREFYAEMCRVERWSVRRLREKMQGMLYERVGLSRRPDAVVRRELARLRDEDVVTPDMVFQDPTNLAFLGLADTYSEADLEAAILRQLERVLQELGSDYCFVARQFPMVIDGVTYRLDLLFFHRRMRCLIAVDLKLGKFQAQDKGQMELYLRWLERHEVRPGEASPQGVILCAEKSREHVELLQLEGSQIHVSEYLTALPPKPVLEAKLHGAVALAREQMARRTSAGET